MSCYNKKNEIVSTGLNRNGELDDVTQHAEIQCIEKYIRQHNETGSPNLSNMTIYTTLESCAQCAGMIVTQGIPNVVYGQKDINRGDVIERLNLDTTKIGGFPKYKTEVNSKKSNDPFASQLDKKYEVANNQEKTPFFIFLQEPKIKNIFQEAREKFRNYPVRHTENISVYKTAKKFVLLPEDEKLKEEVILTPQTKIISVWQSKTTDTIVKKKK